MKYKGYTRRYVPWIYSKGNSSILHSICETYHQDPTREMSTMYKKFIEGEYIMATGVAVRVRYHGI